MLCGCLNVSKLQSRIYNVNQWSFYVQWSFIFMFKIIFYAQSLFLVSNETLVSFQPIEFSFNETVFGVYINSLSLNQR